MAKMNSLWAQMIGFDKTKMDYWVAFRSALGIGLSVLIGYLLKSPAAGLSIAIGALNVCYSDRTDSYSTRGKRMVTAAVFSSLAVFAGAFSANDPVIYLVMLTLIAFFCGMLVVVDLVAADIGVIVVASFLIFSAQPLTAEQSLTLALYAFAGGVMQALLSVALWPLRKYKPERRALAHLYNEHAQLAVVSGNAAETPLGSDRTSETQTQLEALAGDTQTEARRYRSLLSQAERIRITILSLNRLRRRLLREGKSQASVVWLNETLMLSSELLRAVAEVINFRPVKGVAPRYITEIQQRIDRMREERNANESAFHIAVWGDLIYQLDKIAGQLRAIVELTEKITPAGMEEANRKESAKPIHLRYWSGIATIRANLTLKSPGFRHALRLAVCMIVGEVLSHLLKLQRPYWLPMTVAVILKPDYASTFSRSFLRMAGTLLGLVVATGLVYFLPREAWVDVSLICFFTFLVRWAGAANYGVFAMCMAAIVVLLVSLTGVAPADVIWARGANTLLGGFVTLLVFWLWPTSEKLQMAEVIARMLDYYREYFHLVVSKTASAQDLDKVRQKARVARTGFQAATGRFTLEMGADGERIQVLSAVIVASNRFAHATMSLEATPINLKPEQAQAFKEFAAATEKTLILLSEALRGRVVAPNEFPDLRAAYVQFAQPQGGEAFGTLYFETDRVTNSLNTLNEFVMRYLLERRRQNNPVVVDTQEV